jgi:hypothetical protein
LKVSADFAAEVTGKAAPIAMVETFVFRFEWDDTSLGKLRVGEVILFFDANDS